MSPRETRDLRDKERIRLEGRVLSVSDLTASQRDQMCDVFRRHFRNVSREQFNSDLNEKSVALVLEEIGTGEIRGFTSLQQFDVDVEGNRIVAFYSGDTVVDQTHWSQAELFRVWFRHVMPEADRLRRTEADSVYWLLISSGYRTYRLLPLFWRTFFPRHDLDTPAAIQTIVDSLARAKFAERYDAKTGIVKLAHPTPLQAGVSEVTPERLADPQVAFFVERNPGYAAGDELVCLTELTLDNLTRAGEKMLYGRQ